MQCVLILNVVAAERAAILELLGLPPTAGRREDQPLHDRRDTFSVLNRGLDVASTSNVMVLPVRVFTKICTAAFFGRVQ